MEPVEITDFFFFTYFRLMALRVSWLQWSHWSCWLARLCWSPQLVVNGNHSESCWAGVLSLPSWCCLAFSPSALSSSLLRSCFSVVCWKFHWASSSCASSCSAKHNDQLIWVFLDVRIYILYTKKSTYFLIFFYTYYYFFSRTNTLLIRKISPNSFRFLKRSVLWCKLIWENTFIAQHWVKTELALEQLNWHQFQKAYTLIADLI